jgi:hypothetical protein
MPLRGWTLKNPTKQALFLTLLDENPNGFRIAYELLAKFILRLPLYRAA